MLNRPFPGQADNRFEGLRPALWPFGPLTLLTLGPALSLILARALHREKSQ